jgi:ATP-dependent helicase IRC3
VHADIVVASVQTLAQPRRLAQLTDAWSGDSLLVRADPFRLVVIDEAHHAAADSYGRILTALGLNGRHCGCGEPHERDATPEEVDAGHELGVAYDPCPGAGGRPVLLGVTATPDRADGKGLIDTFDEVVASFDILWGIRSGYLSDLRGLAVKLQDFDLSNVKKRGGDFDQGQAGALMAAAGAPQLIVRAWQEHAPGRPTLVFTPTVDLAEQVAQAFTDAGIAAGHVSGTTLIDQRRATLRALHDGSITVITNCAVLTEGYDEPTIGCVIVARPTTSRGLYVQMVGRGTRRHPDKTDCVVLDIVGASEQHSLITIPSLFGLERHFAARAAGGDSIAKVCEEWDDEQVRLGKMRAEDADLFKAVRREGIAWVIIDAGDGVRRYVRTLGTDDAGRPLSSVVLAHMRPDEEDGWNVGLLNPDGSKVGLQRHVTLELAQGIGEDYVRKNGSAHLTQGDARWRRGKPSPKQRAFAKHLKIAVGKDATAGDVADLIDARLAGRKLAGAGNRS